MFNWVHRGRTASARIQKETEKKKTNKKNAIMINGGGSTKMKKERLDQY